jgi:hypothetical protein
MFAGMLVGLLLRRARHRAALRDFPALARRLGLELRPPLHPRAIGKLSGTYSGYRVFVDPDETRRITIRFDSAPGIDLRSYEELRRRPPNLARYFSGHKRFDAYFKTRYATKEIAERLAQAQNLTRLLAPLRGPYAREIRQVLVTSEGISCVLDFGNPPHLPPDAVEFLLPALVELARVIEPHPPDEA